MNSAPFSSGKSHDSPILCVSAVFAVIIMLSAAFVPTISEDSDAVSSDSWVCTITQNGTSLTTKYSVGGEELSDTTAVKGFGDGKTEGSWGYDEDGYGPFGSFYAAFDPNNGNEMVCHLNPYDLTQSVDKESIAGKGYNIMWCLPKIYISVSGSTITLASDDSYGGELAPAFTLKDENGVSTSYNYFALGVYEATNDGSSRLGSVSGTSPQNSTSLDNYRKEAKANEMVEGSVAQLWNFHQYQLYRLCSLAVMENFDSQGQVGYGNCSGNYFSQTGNMDVGGPYQGTSGHSDKGVKLFIENAWGSLFEYVDDAWWSEAGLSAGQNLRPEPYATNKTLTTVAAGMISGFSGWGTSPSTKIDSWGLPTAKAKENSPSAPDWMHSSAAGRALIVGGNWGAGDLAGLSLLYCEYGGSLFERYHFGSRLAFLFDTDSPPKLSVKYMDDGTQMKSDSVQKGQGYTISDPMSTKEGFTFVGWSHGTELYHPGDSITVVRSITLAAVWDGHTVTFDLKGGTWDRADAAVAEGGVYTVPSAVPTKDGYTFKGWMCGDDSVLPGGTIKLSSDVTLQAVWTSDSIPIIPIIPDDGDDPMEVVIDKKDGSGSGIDGKTVLLIAVIVAIIAELTVLTVSRKR